MEYFTDLKSAKQLGTPWTHTLSQHPPLSSNNFSTPRPCAQDDNGLNYGPKFGFLVSRPPDPVHLSLPAQRTKYSQNYVQGVGQNAVAPLLCKAVNTEVNFQSGSSLKLSLNYLNSMGDDAVARLQSNAVNPTEQSSPARNFRSATEQRRDALSPYYMMRKKPSTGQTPLEPHTTNGTTYVDKVPTCTWESIHKKDRAGWPHRILTMEDRPVESSPRAKALINQQDSTCSRESKNMFQPHEDGSSGISELASIPRAKEVLTNISMLEFDAELERSGFGKKIYIDLSEQIASRLSSWTESEDRLRQLHKNISTTVGTTSVTSNFIFDESTRTE